MLKLLQIYYFYIKVIIYVYIQFSVEGIWIIEVVTYFTIWINEIWIQNGIRSYAIVMHHSFCDNLWRFTMHVHAFTAMSSFLNNASLMHRWKKNNDFSIYIPWTLTWRNRDKVIRKLYAFSVNLWTYAGRRRSSSSDSHHLG